MSKIIPRPQLRKAKIGDMSEGVVKRQILGIDDGFSRKSLDELDIGKKTQDMNVAAAFSEVYTSVSSNRAAMIREVDRMAPFYLVNTITTQIVEDALAPDTATGNILDLTATDPTIKKYIKELEETINFDQLVKDITTDLVKYGEYTLRNTFKGEDSETDVEGEKSGGIESVIDDVDQASVIALTKNGKTSGYLVFDHAKGRVSKKPPKRFTKFTLDGERVRIELDKFIPSRYLEKENVQKALEDVPRFIRVGKSIIFPVLPKIKELELMEKLVPATKLNKLSGGSIVGMSLPETYDIDEALNATKRLESIINNKIAINDDLEEVTVQSIMSTAGRIKVLPVFGDKGRMEKMDYKSDEPDDLLNSVREIRKVILDSIGVPYELVFSSDGDSKGEILKRYAKYLRRLKNIQRALTKGIIQLVKTHAYASGHKKAIKDEDVHVKFINKLVEIDNIDRLEHMDVTVSMCDRLTTYVEEKLLGGESNLAEYVDIDVYKNYLKEQFASIGMPGLISDKKINVVQDNSTDTEEEPE